jgi:mannose-6-phosphate isomerase-like protein (cupin superfamily)
MSVLVLPPGGGRSFGPGIRAKVEYGQSTDFAAFESDLPPRWDGPPPHVHCSYDEAFYVLAGSVAFACDGTVSDCPAGSFVFVPRGSAHGFGNPAESAARILVITTPGAIRLVEGVYELLGRGGPPDPAAMAALYGSFDSEVLVPEAQG